MKTEIYRNEIGVFVRRHEREAIVGPLVDGRHLPINMLPGCQFYPPGTKRRPDGGSFKRLHPLSPDTLYQLGLHAIAQGDTEEACDILGTLCDAANDALWQQENLRREVEDLQAELSYERHGWRDEG